MRSVREPRTRLRAARRWPPKRCRILLTGDLNAIPPVSRPLPASRVVVETARRPDSDGGTSGALRSSPGRG
jgi:hypothetical protein